MKIGKRNITFELEVEEGTATVSFCRLKRNVRNKHFAKLNKKLGETKSTEDDGAGVVLIQMQCLNREFHSVIFDSCIKCEWKLNKDAVVPFDLSDIKSENLDEDYADAILEGYKAFGLVQETEKNELTDSDSLSG